MCHGHPFGIRGIREMNDGRLVDDSLKAAPVLMTVDGRIMNGKLVDDSLKAAPVFIIGHHTVQHRPGAWQKLTIGPAERQSELSNCNCYAKAVGFLALQQADAHLKIGRATISKNPICEGKTNVNVCGRRSKLFYCVLSTGLNDHSRSTPLKLF